MPRLGRARVCPALEGRSEFQACHRSQCGYSAVSRAVNVRPLKLKLGPVDIPEPLQHVRTQCEAESRSVRSMHHAVRTDVERLVKELPHHRHVALGYLQDVAVGCRHRDVDACREQHTAAPGVRSQTNAVRRSQCRDAPDLRQTARAGDVRLRDIEGTALKQILEVEPRELALARGDGDDRRTPHLRLAGVIVR